MCSYVILGTVVLFNCIGGTIYGSIYISTYALLYNLCFTSKRDDRMDYVVLSHFRMSKLAVRAWITRAKPQELSAADNA